MNSFGFGGTNGHAILESYEQGGDRRSSMIGHDGRLFVLGANSAQALVMRITQLGDYLRSHPQVDLGRLARTLFLRAEFAFRAAFSASSAEQLAAKLDGAVLNNNNNKIQRAMVIPESLPVRILGVFTGQGAQWPTMGAGLYKSSAVFRNSIVRMQHSLDSLPDKQDRPDWTLLGELSAPAAQSRMDNAAISQPLSTALQVALVDMLRAGGVQLAGIVAHSSGEVAAAYAAGYIEAHDAIRIAYLRGLHSHRAQGPDGQDGKMMAVGMSHDQANAFCDDFGNSISVAAINSTRSCTLAGNASAIDAAREKLEAAGVFVRVLQVDKAYHSNHMLPVAPPYLKSLSRCNINVCRSNSSSRSLSLEEDKCPWYSSVWGSSGRSRSFMQQDEVDALQGQYWADNMIRPVRFAEAIRRAVEEGPVYDIVLEIGPHPALKGPVSETITSMTGVSVPYIGLLKRGESDVEAFHDALGILWQSFSLQGSRQLVTHQSVQQMFATSDNKEENEEDNGYPALLTNLPPYPFQHDTVYWKESRASAMFRTQSQPPHQLLGHSTTFGSDGRHEVHWRQILRLEEIPWLRGHRIQGEYLFPATAFVTMAYEAAIRLAGTPTHGFERMELRDIEIFRAINLEPDSSGTEILFTMSIADQSSNGSSNSITGRWACYSAPADVERGYSLGDAPTPAKAHAEGTVLLVPGLGPGPPPTHGVLPQRTEPALPLHPTDVEEFYKTLATIGHEYTDSFQACAVLRRLDHALISMPPAWDEAALLTRPDMNPAALDATLHGLFAAHSCPGDGRQRSVYLPARIDSICISMRMPLTQVNPKLEADCFVTHADAKGISGDVNVFDPASGQTSVQLRGVHLSALPGSQLPDRQLYAHEVWDRDMQFGLEPGRETCVTGDGVEVQEMAARLVLSYCRKLAAQVKPFEAILMSKNRSNLIQWVYNHLLPMTQAGTYPGTSSAWIKEEDRVSESIADGRVDGSKAASSADVALIRALGSNLVSITRGLTAAVEVAEKDDALSRFYADGVGFREAISNTAAIVAQISHRYPAMDIAEVGFSFGPGLRRAVLDKVGKRRYKSYTVTNALASAGQRDPKIVFQPLDMAKDPIPQGFAEGIYDTVIATTSYSTNISQETLGYARKLLRPGGFLVLIAMTEDYLPVRFVLSLLPGSWLEKDNGQAQIVSVSECDLLLKEAGFSGVDTSLTTSFCSVMVSQALDTTVTAISDPMSLMQQQLEQQQQQQLGAVEILVVHDPTPSYVVTNLVSRVTQRLRQMGGIVRTVSSLDDICVPPGGGGVIVNLCDLDSPVFSKMEEPRFRGLQCIVRNASALLWVTKGAQDGTSPESTMVLGWARCARLERSSFRTQILDVAQEISKLDADMLVKLLLNLVNHHGDDKETVWTLEPELVLKDDALYIPRLWPMDQMNTKSIARSKEVTIEVAATNQWIKLDERGQLTVAGASCHNDDAPAQSTSWEILASSVHRLRLQGELEPKRLCTIRCPATRETLLVLISPTAMDVEGPGVDVVYRYDDDDESQPAHHYSDGLHQLLRAAIAEATLSHVNGPVWVHGAPVWLAAELDRLVLRRTDVQLFQTTNSIEGHNANMVFLHPLAMKRDIVLAIPKDASTLICLGDTQQGDTLVNLVAKYRPAMKIVRLSASPASHNGAVYRYLSRSALADLSKVMLLASGTTATPPLPADGEYIIPVQDIPNTDLSTAPPVAVFDRTTVPTVTAKLLPPSHAGLFSGDKTYLLLGLAGDMGISIAIWLLENGARHIVLASRNPRVSQQVIDHAAAAYGADLRFMAVDVCSHTCLSVAWAEIHSSMPPLGGIMHGAMVMHDQLFVDQPWADFSAVLAPKVTGTRNLMALLEGEAKPAQLEFVLLFSSAVASAGNAGQAAYAAAGCFMQGVAVGLRHRGIAASVLHIGPVCGLGYLHRQERRREIQQSLDRTFAAISEMDLLDMIAEAVAAGRRPGGPVAFITGIRDDMIHHSWHHHPRLWHYLKSDDGDNDDGTAKADGAVSLQAQLAAAVGDENTCLELLLQHFGLALCAILHTRPDELETNLPVASLGIDSLVAVRVREWFMHHVGVELSVLKIMSANVTQVELCKGVLATWRRQIEN